MIPRWREVVLLILGHGILGLGFYVVWQAYLPVWRASGMSPTLVFGVPAGLLAAWLCVSAVLARNRCQETLLLPVVAFLVGLSLLFLLRLEGGSLLHRVALEATFHGGFRRQLTFFGVGWAALMGLLLIRRDYRTFARYKYLVAATAVGLLLATTLFGSAVHGQTLELDFGPISFQPHDLVKLLLVVFMAAYLVEKRELLAFAAGRGGLLTRMDFRYLGPMIALWLLVLVIIFKHDDLGAALLLFGVLLGMLYLGTGRKTYVALGLLLVVAGVFAGYHLGKMAHLGFAQRLDTRVSIWLDPWQDPDNRGHQITQALMAFGNGRVVGAGLGGGYPETIPAIHTDMIYAAISEDLGLLGGVFVLGLFVLLIGRMYRIGLQASDRFGQLLAAGLATSLAIQAWVILGGTLKFIPLTGITLPFVSAGGTSLVVNLLLLGLVLKVAEAPATGTASAFRGEE